MTKSTHPSGKSYTPGKYGSNKEQIKMLARMFGNLQVVDSVANLIVTVDPDDARGAIPANAEDCVFSRACHRLFHSSKAIFFRSVVYIDLPDENEVRRLYRFKAGTRMSGAIRRYDKTGTFAPGTYLLLAPSKSQNLDEVRKRSRRFGARRSPGKKTLLRLKARVRSKEIKAGTRRVKTIALAAEASSFVRKGSGLIQTKLNGI